MSVKNQPIIVVRRKKVVHGGHHGGAWKVAYADFVTAMMAFFLVMWLVSQGKPVKAAIGGYFRDPGAFATTNSQGILPGGKGLDPEAASPKIDDAEKVLKEAVKQIQNRLAPNAALAALRNQIEFTVTPEGLRIDLVDADRSSFFDSGSAELRGEANEIIGVIAHELAPLGDAVVIEGHTDSQRYAANDRYSNWELSADRANAARRSMERQGFPPDLVSGVRGRADRLPRIRDKPFDSRNRRVSIVVQNPTTSAEPSNRAAAPVDAKAVEHVGQKAAGPATP